MNTEPGLPGDPETKAEVSGKELIGAVSRFIKQYVDMEAKKSAENMKFHAVVIAAALILYFTFAAWSIAKHADSELIEITKTLAAVATGYLGYLAGRRA